MCSKSAADDAVSEGIARRWPLALTLTLWYALAGFAIFCVAALLIYVGLVGSLNRDHDEFLWSKAEVLRELLRERPGDQVALQDEVDEGWVAGQYARVCARVVGADGKTVVESSRMDPELSVDAFAGVPRSNPAAPSGTTLDTRSGKPFRAIVVTYGGGERGVAGVTIQVAMETYGSSHLLLAVRQRLYWLLGGLLVVGGVVGHVIARRGLRPIAEMSAAAATIGSATLDRRLDVTACPAEVAELAASFNGVLDRLEEAFERLSRFSADIAHELRTPVNNLRVQAEVTLQRSRTAEEYRGAVASSLEEGVRLSRIIDSLLFLARADNPATQVAREPLDACGELRVIREFYEAAANEAGVTLEVACEARQALWADRVLLQRAVGNLVENSLAHTPAGGRITLAGRDGEGAVILEVVDTGSGIPAEHLSRITDRFYRVDPARAGRGTRVGLGLSIVKSIVALHGGSLEVRSAPGEGTRVALGFPESPDGVPGYLPRTVNPGENATLRSVEV
jgi:two-component system heavy metal sensor histidine kinase CusS